MRKINWGVIGTAGIAKGQTIPGMSEAENCRLYAIAGRDPRDRYRGRLKKYYSTKPMKWAFWGLIVD